MIARLEDEDGVPLFYDRRSLLQLDAGRGEAFETEILHVPPIHVQTGGADDAPPTKQGKKFGIHVPLYLLLTFFRRRLDVRISNKKNNSCINTPNASRQYTKRLVPWVWGALQAP